MRECSVSSNVRQWDKLQVDSETSLSRPDAAYYASKICLLFSLAEIHLFFFYSSHPYLDHHI